jgi:hypothetical protein
MTMLALFTLLSTAVALGASFVAWRYAKEDRLRSEARVAALAAAITADPRGATDAVPQMTARAAARPAEKRPDRDDWHDLPLGHVHTDPQDTRHAADLFASAQLGTTKWRLRPALAIAAIAAITVMGTLLIASRSERTAAVETPAAPLELLALRHTQEDGTTTITGLVRNPSGGAVMERATAVAFFFDASGTFLASARAPLDFTRLAAGEESSFHVSLATPPGASRYRVSFRYAEGGLVPHVDRRRN